MLKYGLLDKLIDAEEKTRGEKYLISFFPFVLGRYCSKFCLRVRAGNLGYVVSMANTIQGAAKEIPAIKEAVESTQRRRVHCVFPVS